MNDVIVSVSHPTYGTVGALFETGRSEWPHGLRRSYAAACVLRLRVLIPPGAWIFACCECCVLSGRCLCDGLITRLAESYLLCASLCVIYKPQKRGGPGPLWPATLKGEKKIQNGKEMQWPCRT